MLGAKVFLLSCLLGYSVAFPAQSTDQELSNSQFQKQGTSGGNAAAAGNAGTSGKGSASSINQANQQATDKMTQSNALSANTAEGEGPQTSGAAQAGGTLNFASQGVSNKARQGSSIQPMGGFNNGGFDNGGFNNGGFNNGGFNNGGFNNGGFNNNQREGGFNNHGHGFNNGGFNNGGFNNGGFNNGGAVQDTRGHIKNTQSQQQGTSGGNAAAAGNAGSVGPGQASSINQADQFSDADSTRESGLSANDASGFSPNTSGAAQAGGNLSKQSQRGSQSSRFHNRNNDF